MKIPIENQKGFIEEFEKIRPEYEEFAELLKIILAKAVEKIGSLAIIQVRVKDLSSFSSKIISKDKYQDPISEMTDLCGARVIVHFQSQVEQICLFIKDKENFNIDEANSLDAKSRLKVSEFGYRSIHYIVTIKKDSILDVKIDEKFKGMKAEIQVRTFIEHIWADISHDRIYKTKFNIPEEWRREAARLSAILENADIMFGKMSNTIDSLGRIYEVQYEKQKAEFEIEKLRTLISVQEKNVDACSKSALALSSLYMAKDFSLDAKNILKGWLDKPIINPMIHAKILFEFGMVSCLSKFEDIDATEYCEGMKAIEQSLVLFTILPAETLTENKEEMSYIYYRFGRLLQLNSEKSDKSLEFIGKAQHILPDNPLYFVAMMECIVLRNIDLAEYNINLFKSGIESTIDKLKELIEIGIEKVSAWFAIGRCYFFLHDKVACIDAYSNAVQVILNDKYLTNQSIIYAEISLIRSLKHFDVLMTNQIQLYLNITMFLSRKCLDKTRFKNYLENKKIRKDLITPPVIIIAGGASKMEITKVEEYEGYIKELMITLKGTIISGGTMSGIPGLVGRLKTEKKETTPPLFDLITYLPKKLPDDAIKSTAYDFSYEIDSSEFSALEILTMWNDLVIGGINPAEVILIGIDGGVMATMEYQIALSLGAKVGLVNHSGRATSDFLKDNIWKKHPNLLQLPDDPLTVWALVNQQTETNLTKSEIDTLAPQIHEFYRQKKLEELNPQSDDVNKFKVLMPWNKLDPSLQQANLKQVAFIEHILKRVNLGIRKAKNPAILNIRESLTKQDYELLAKLEHARWNAERLLDGWRYGQEKDLVHKLNPYIISWAKLDDATRQYDYDPVDNIPFLLQNIGYEVYKLNGFV